MFKLLDFGISRLEILYVYHDHLNKRYFMTLNNFCVSQESIILPYGSRRTLHNRLTDMETLRKVFHTDIYTVNVIFLFQVMSVFSQSLIFGFFISLLPPSVYDGCIFNVYTCACP